MPTPALLVHSVLLSLSQMTGLVQSPMDSLPINKDPWEGDVFQVGTRIVWKNQGFDSAGIQKDSARIEILIRPEGCADLTLYRSRLSQVGSQLRQQSWGHRRNDPADSMKLAVKTASTEWIENFTYRKQENSNTSRWITTPGPGWAGSAPFDTIDQSGTSSSTLQVRREREVGWETRVDSLWRTHDGTPIRSSENLQPITNQTYNTLMGQTHAYLFQSGHMVVDTLRSHGYQTSTGNDTSWTDTLRYTWENGRLVRYTSSIDTLWMEWSATGQPVRHLRHTWSPRFPGTSPQSLNVLETRWDALGRQISHLETYSRSDNFYLDSTEFEGTSPFPIKNISLICRKSSQTSLDLRRTDCHMEDLDLYQTEISGVPVRFPARAARPATVHMDGKTAIFQNLSIASGVLELVSPAGKAIGKSQVTDGQAILANPPRGVSLWRVRSHSGVVSEASRLILP